MSCRSCKHAEYSMMSCCNFELYITVGLFCSTDLQVFGCLRKAILTGCIQLHIDILAVMDVDALLRDAQFCILM